MRIPLLKELNEARIKENLIPLKEKDNKGGGDCLFLSILDGGLNKLYPGLTVNVMRIAISEWCEKNETLYLRTMKESLLAVYNFFWNDSEPDFKTFIHEIKTPGSWQNFNTDFIINVITEIYDIMITIVSTVPDSMPLKIYRFGRSTRKILEEDIIFIGHISEFHYIALVEDVKPRIRFVSPITGVKKEYISYEEMAQDRPNLEKEYLEVDDSIFNNKCSNREKMCDRRSDLMWLLKIMNYLLIKHENKDPEEVKKSIKKLMDNEKNHRKNLFYQRTYMDMFEQFDSYDKLIKSK